LGQSHNHLRFPLSFIHCRFHYSHVDYSQTSINPANPTKADLHTSAATRCAAPVNCVAPLPVADGELRVALPVPSGIGTVPEARVTDDNPDGSRDIAEAVVSAPGVVTSDDVELLDNSQLLKQEIYTQ
jgi:hypothetical protein